MIIIIIILYAVSIVLQHLFFGNVLDYFLEKFCFNSIWIKETGRNRIKLYSNVSSFK